MAKLTLDDLANLDNPTSAVTDINSNNAAIEAAVENTLSRDGTAPNTMEAVLDMNSNKITNLAAPTANADAARKLDVDTAIAQTVTDAAAAAASAAAALVSENNAATSETNAATSETNAATSETNAAGSEASAAASASAAIGAVSGFPFIKTPVTVATTINVTLSGEQTIDGVLTSTSSVLVRMQDDPEDNGIYTTAAGAWTRRSDFNEDSEVNGAQVTVLDGLVNRGKVFSMISSIATLGTDEQLWINLEGGGSLHAAAGASRGVLCTLGDSNYGGRPGFYAAMLKEWRSAKAPFEDWTHYNHGLSGYTIGTSALNEIVIGDKAALPGDYVPGGGNWDGNIWRVVNSQANILVFSLGINDMNSVASRSTYGSPENFRANFEKLMYFLITAMPRTSFLLQCPAPYAGEDFVVTGFNTDWAADAPASEPTIDGNAAYCSALIRSVYLEWENRHPRISVWDSAELFGTRCDDPLVDSQDPETGTDLIDDSLHFSDFGALRVVQYLSRKMGVENRRTSTPLVVTTESMCENTYWSRAYFCAGASNSGANTLLALRTSPGSVFWLEDRLDIANSVAPMGEIVKGEMAELLGDLGSIRAFLALRGSEINVKFLTSGNTYTGGPVSLSSVVTDADGEKQYKLQINGVNMGAEDANQAIIVWVESPAMLPFIQKACSFNIDGTAGGGGIHNQWEENWRPTVFEFSRGVGSNAITVDLYALNQNDGRLVDGSPIEVGDLPSSPYSAPGVLVATGTLGNGFYKGTLTLNATDWPSGFFDFKSSYNLVGRVSSGTLIGQGTITVKE